MDTLKQCMITFCAATIVVSLGIAYLTTTHFPYTADLFWFIGFIMVSTQCLFLACMRYAYYLIQKSEKDKMEALEREFECKKEWAKIDLELKAKEMSLKMEWKVFEQELLMKEKDASSQRTMNEKKIESELAIDEKKTNSEILIAEKHAVINRAGEIKKLGISITTNYDINK